MIILIKGKLDTLDAFVDAMAAGREDVIVFDINNPEETFLPYADKIDENTLVITFNNLGTTFDIFKNRGAKIYNFLVDHPSFYINLMTRDYYDGYHALCVDRKHVEYLKEIFPSVADSFMFMPHGGIDNGGMDVDKDIDVLYAGSFMGDDEINFPPLPFEHDSERFFEFLFSYYEKDSTAEPQDAVKAYIEYYGLSVPLEEYVVMVNYALRSVNFAYLANRRRTIIEKMAQAGINVHVCGTKNWEELADKYPNITYHGFISPQECLELIGRTKVLINDHPNFVSGSHERVYNGMLNGAVVLSNYSKYFDERFIDNEEILFWDGKNYDEAISKVKTVLEDDSLRTSIASKAYAKAQNETWSNRLSEITSIFMGR